MLQPGPDDEVERLGSACPVILAPEPSILYVHPPLKSQLIGVPFGIIADPPSVMCVPLGVAIYTLSFVFYAYTRFRVNERAANPRINAILPAATPHRAG
jgi:hypothetical protein